MKKILRRLPLIVTLYLASCDHPEASRTAKEKRIEGIEIKYVGEKWVEEDHLMRFIHVTAGSAYTTKSVDSSIRALYESGYVDDLRVLEQAMGEDVRLIFEITSRPALGQNGPPLFVGNTVFSDQRLARELDFVRGAKVEALTNDRFRKNSFLIMEFYRREGYSEANVTFRAFGGGPATPEDFPFVVQEGEKRPSR